MSSLKTQQPERSSGFFTSIWFSFLEWFLPSKTKRMIFMACVFSHMVDIDSPTERTLAKLNKLLHLSRDNESMRFPIQIRHAIWKALEDPILFDDGHTMTVYEAMKTDNPTIVDKAIETIIKRAPHWVLYDSILVITNELRFLHEKMAVSFKETIISMGESYERKGLI